MGRFFNATVMKAEKGIPGSMEQKRKTFNAENKEEPSEHDKVLARMAKARAARKNAEHTD